MGIHASPTCVMNMENATGYLVGEPHKGMRAMFIMMNFARLTVGVEGTALSEIAYQTAVAFCRDRRQGRSLNPARRDDNAKADNILVHPDVRRQLLNVRATTEGMRALGLWVAGYIDVAAHHEDEEERQQADDMVALLTPIIKSYCTERGFQNVSDCMKTVGRGTQRTAYRAIPTGLSYRDDLRRYKSCAGLDLIGRKLPKDGGRLYKTFAKTVRRYRSKTKKPISPNLRGYSSKALNRLNETTMALAKGKGHGRPKRKRLQLPAITSIYSWSLRSPICGRVWAGLLTVKAVNLRDKIQDQYYFTHILPETESLVRLVEAGKGGMADFNDDEFRVCSTSVRTAYRHCPPPEASRSVSLVPLMAARSRNVNCLTLASTGMRSFTRCSSRFDRAANSTCVGHADHARPSHRGRIVNRLWLAHPDRA